jgi:hypothetical protein
MSSALAPLVLIALAAIAFQQQLSFWVAPTAARENHHETGSAPAGHCRGWIQTGENSPAWFSRENGGNLAP